MTGSALLVRPADRSSGPAHPMHDVMQPHGDDAVTLGLEAGAALLAGGDALLPTGLPMALGMEHQPDFVRAVADACRNQALSGRDWYAHGAITLVGPANSGRGHAARRLAAATGLPLFVADASTSAGRASLRGDAAPGCGALPPFAVSAIAASGCANPIILVEGLSANDDVAGLLAPFLDPDRAFRFESDRLRCSFDLGEVNWLIQVDEQPGGTAHRLPQGWSSVVPFRGSRHVEVGLLHQSLLEAVALELSAAGALDARALEKEVGAEIPSGDRFAPIGDLIDRLVLRLAAGGVP